jgi:hypothetical protein
MKISLQHNGLLILPESEFEEAFINEKFGRGQNFKNYVKCGLSPADLIGIKIEFPKVGTD